MPGALGRSRSRACSRSRPRRASTTSPSSGGWAKYMFDRGLAAVRAPVASMRPTARGSRPSNLYDVDVEPLGLSIREMFAARMQANAARAVALGLGRSAGAGAAARSTRSTATSAASRSPRRAYTTAVLAVNQHAFPYGGIELARLYDGDQRVVVERRRAPGGRASACWSATPRRRRCCFSQRGRDADAPAQPPIELLVDSRGPVHRAKPYPRRPYGGTFQTMVARGRTAVSEVVVETTHRFKADARRDALEGRAPAASSAATPSTCCFPRGARARRVEAVLAKRRARDAGAEGTSPRRRVRMRDVAYFYIAGEESGYVVVPTGAPRGTAHILHAASANPPRRVPGRRWPCSSSATRGSGASASRCGSRRRRTLTRRPRGRAACVPDAAPPARARAGLERAEAPASRR